MSETKFGRFKLTKPHYMKAHPNDQFAVVIPEDREVVTGQPSVNMEPLDDTAKELMAKYKANRLAKDMGIPAAPKSLDDMIATLSAADKAALIAKLAPPKLSLQDKQGR